MMQLSVKSPGSGGELIQGTLGGEPFLVTCPIDLYAEAFLSDRPNVSACEKACLAYKKTLLYLGRSGAPRGIRLHSALPRGKGLASSSADIAAVCQLTALSLGCRLTAREIAAIAVSIEPTDGVFYDGIVQMNHMDGTVKKTWPCPPDISLLLFDLGGAVDTLAFNRRRDLGKLNEEKESAVRRALELLDRGFSKKDPRLIGQAATMSAFANQKILWKKPLEALYHLALDCGAAGINIAHSGTAVGMIFSAAQTREKVKAKTAMQKKYPEIPLLHEARLISGGLRIEENDDTKSI